MKLFKKDPPYPIHGRSLGMLGTPREPYTWWDCGHGHQTMGSPWHPPKPPECFKCQMDEAMAAMTQKRRPKFWGSHWRPADPLAARARTVEALDGKPDLIARHDRRP